MTFGMRVLKAINFIKGVQPLSSSAEALWVDLKDAEDDVRLHKQGKIKLKKAQELLNEL